jgi:hypothetical protein
MMMVPVTVTVTVTVTYKKLLHFELKTYTMKKVYTLQK